MQRLFPIVAACALASTTIAAAGAAESTDNNASLRDEVRALQQNYDRQLQALEQRLAQAESNHVIPVLNLTPANTMCRMIDSCKIKRR